MATPTQTLSRRYLSNEQAADFLGLSPNTLQVWRCTFKGPPFIKRGGRVWYDESDLIAWMERGRICPANEARA